MKKTDKILVTGASGFIGSRLLKMLWELGYTNLRATSYGRDLKWDFDGVNLFGDLHLSCPFSIGVSLHATIENPRRPCAGGGQIH